MSDERDPTENYHRGNRASRDAFSGTPSSVRAKQRTVIREWFFSRAEDGGTSDECEQALGIIHQACSARITELKRDGGLIPTGARRKTRSGRGATVLVSPPYYIAKEGE